MRPPSFDATVKTLVEIDPRSWPDFIGCPSGPTSVIDADIATISGAGDKILRVDADPKYLLHLEFATGHDGAALPPLLNLRNAAFSCRHDLLPVLSVVLLLRPEADSPQLNGVYERSLAGPRPYVRFEYAVRRVWQMPAKLFLNGGLALLPFAPIAAVTEDQLPGIIRRMQRRLRGRARRLAAQIMGAAYILSGLRYSPELAAQVFAGVRSMKESSTYQAILSEGRAEGRAEGRLEGEAQGRKDEVRRLIRSFGENNLGAPDASTAAAIERLDDLAQLENLLSRVFQSKSWSELFPKSKLRKRRGSQD